MDLRRRVLLGGVLAAPAIIGGIGRARATDTTIKIGALKLIHSMTPYFYQQFAPPGTKIEIITFESPTDGKNAVVTKSVDVGTFGIAAAIFSVSAHEPLVVIGSECNKGMAIVAGKNSGIDALKDLKGKRVAIWPGSTQEVFVLERLHMEGMSVKDIEPVRVSFSEMPAALQRGDVDGYVGAEPGPSLSITSGVGKIVEYPYSTPMGSLNMILATHKDTVAANPEMLRLVVKLQKQASEYAMAHPDEMVAMTIAKLGQKKEAVAASVANVELNWQMTPTMLANARSYAEHMQEMKQIKAVPDMNTLMDTQFSDAAAHGA